MINRNEWMQSKCIVLNPSKYFRNLILSRYNAYASTAYTTIELKCSMKLSSPSFLLVSNFTPYSSHTVALRTLKCVDTGKVATVCMGLGCTLFTRANIQDVLEHY